MHISKVRSCKVGTMPECVQLYRKYKLRIGLLVRYRPLHIGAGVKWEPRERHWSLGKVDYVDETTGYFRLSRF